MLNNIILYNVSNVQNFIEMWHKLSKIYLMEGILQIYATG